MNQPILPAFHFGPLFDGRRTAFRLWAPSAREAFLLIDGEEERQLERRGDGFWHCYTEAGPGTRYKFRIGDTVFPDLASRQQDGDTGGWSIVRAPLPAPSPSYAARPWHECVICEVHIGTATPEGTFSALASRLEHFRDAGYTALEIMPVNEFPGRRNWGYDGTLIFAPESAYGSPAELRALVDRAHALGLSMILDVVYNHFGTIDNFARKYAPEWFDENETTPWGPAIDFTREPVRQFYYENAAMWLGEYGFDGLRFDAIHEVRTEARDKFLGELAAAARGAKPGAKLIIENAENSFRWLERDKHNNPMTYLAQWNDDIHHVLAYVATGEGKKTGYDDPKKDPIADLEKALAHGFVHDRAEGPASDGKTRGGPASQLPPDAFITYVENHDQIGNRVDGKRLSSRISPEQLDFLHFVKFLAPQLPLCFMGDEANLDSGFPFFVDLAAEDGDAADRRRYDEMREFFNEQPSHGDLPHPNDPATFERAKLDWTAFGDTAHAAALQRFQQLAGWRREFVWPLTATACLDTETARYESALIINWSFDAGTLSMAANPSAQARDFPCIILGSPVATGSYNQMGEVLRLGPWSAVVWSVR